MRLFTRCILPGLALLLLASPLRADVLFSQPVIDGGVALASDFARFQQEADNFALPQAAAVQTVHWWGVYANNDMPTDNFTLRFFADTAGNPALTPVVNVSLSGVTRTATSLHDNLGDLIYSYETTLPTSVLFDGTTPYYLSLVNNTGDWDWVGSGPGTHWARPDDASAWTVSSNTTDFSFELSGTPVPEPSTLLLLAVSTVGMIAWPGRRKRRARKEVGIR